MKRLRSLLVAIALMAPVACSAHDNYPVLCCGGMDCGPITALRMLPNGNKYITIHTIYGSDLSAEFPAERQSQPPIDERDHACIRPTPQGNLPLCLFLNGGV